MERLVHPAYLAGLLDGEGCLTIVRENRSRQQVRSFVPLVAIQMGRAESLMVDLAAQYGGTLSNRKQQGKWSTQFKWAITSAASIRAVLEDALPYLRVKDQQARVLLQYLDEREEMGSYKARTETERDRLEELCEEIQRLNKKGDRVTA